MKKDFMGAGFLPFCHNTNRFLVLLRNDPKPTWGTVGGGRDNNETPIQTAKREFAEETRIRPNCKVINSYVNDLHKGIYYNFIGVFDKEFKPKLDNENIDYKWCGFKKLLNLEDKHYGLLELLQNDYKTIKNLCS